MEVDAVAAGYFGRGAEHHPRFVSDLLGGRKSGGGFLLSPNALLGTGGRYCNRRLGDVSAAGNRTEIGPRFATRTFARGTPYDRR